jgi:hypothetical protein
MMRFSFDPFLVASRSDFILTFLAFTIPAPGGFSHPTNSNQFACGVVMGQFKDFLSGVNENMQPGQVAGRRGGSKLTY